MSYRVSWTVQVHDEAETYSNSDLFGYGDSPLAALRNLYGTLTTRAEDAANRAANEARAVARIRGELEALEIT